MKTYLKAAMALAFIQLVFTCPAQNNIRFRSNVQYPHILSNLWGYADSSGREYALVGEETGLAIVDITDPDHPNSLFFVPNDTSRWQEPKVWSHYAYVTNEHDHGLLIVDLADLPYNVTYKHWDSVPNENFKTAHSCFIDENGIIYLTGTNIYNHMLMCDLKPDPMNPTYLGFYNERYVHDCFARNDTLFASEIQAGQFSVIDVHNKTHPSSFVSQSTPFRFSHNIWLSDDSRYLFNTDEKKFAPVTSYDISDFSNITELDQYRHSDSDSSVVHNTYYRNGYLYTSYYRDGVTIVDAHKPDNLVEVGYFDTSPYPAGAGFEGCWGVYCFLPSGNIICSDRQEGLFVLSPTLQRACYLEGQVTDATTNQPLPNIQVDIIGQPRSKITNFSGDYKTGVADSGLYDVRFTDFNTHCQTLIVGGVMLQAGQVTTLNTRLSCSFPNSISNLAQPFTFTAMPAVFSSVTQIHFQSQSQDATIFSLFNDLGQLISTYQVQTPNATLQLGSQLSNGSYTLLAKQGLNTKTLRLTKL
jgi:choice-of-anchor B domain-containing protein